MAAEAVEVEIEVEAAAARSDSSSRALEVVEAEQWAAGRVALAVDSSSMVEALAAAVVAGKEGWRVERNCNRVELQWACRSTIKVSSD